MSALEIYRRALSESDNDFLEDIVELYDDKLEKHRRRLFAHNESLKGTVPSVLFDKWQKETADHLDGFAVGVRADRVYFRAAFFQIHMAWDQKFQSAKTLDELDSIRRERDEKRDTELKSQVDSLHKFYDRDYSQHVRAAVEFFRRPDCGPQATMNA